MVETEQACGWTIRYQSVIGFGRASVVETAADKERGLAPSGSDMLRRKMT
jgi:nitroimidazol reductase NimA-like FMN-containing flavoprotein (pyridoxamine 5'-phosphate oxidase superfamily)